MHPSRRRKKRPNYGIRTVEVVRGPNGFGFTISGQQPCILSCIVTNSPADQAGLRAGDFLISVNGISVSKITHDAVVNLIGNSVGPIKMTIAENYYSDSSDEELDVSRMMNRKPKFMHKPRPHRLYKEVHKKANKAEYYQQQRQVVDTDNAIDEEAGPIEYKALVGYLGTIEMPKQLMPNSRLQTVCSCIRKLRQEKRSPTAVLMTIFPTCLTLKNAFNHILAIYPTNRVVYIGSTTDKESRYFGLVTSAGCDTTKKINNCDDEIESSNSCHVFMVDSKLVEHQTHQKKADSFKISCTTDVITGNCLEFPKNALYIVNLVQNMYKLQNDDGRYRIGEDLMPVVANSPQPSASSNSDSGIGFRDDCNISDRILVVEFPAHRTFPTIVTNNRPTGINGTNSLLESLNNDNFEMNNRCKNNLDTIKLPNNLSKDYEIKQMNNINNIRACETNIKNVLDKSELLIKQNNDHDICYNRLTCRAMPDRPINNNKINRALSPLSIVSSDDNNPIYAEPRPVKGLVQNENNTTNCPNNHNKKFDDDELDFKSSFDNVSMHSSNIDLKNIFKIPMNVNKKPFKLVNSCDNLDIVNYKLSPKVYGLNKPNHSCEELNNLDVEKFGYGSLQELCWKGEETKCCRRNVAQSEPDVRIHDDLCDEQNGGAKIMEGPSAWANSFEKLLDDHIGLHTFAEFLKKEFSAENIYFWTACERYRHLPQGPERIIEAQRIYQQHLCIGAPEPVNVDSQGRQCTEQQLENASPTLFDQAQKQIFNLMKFDSYPRFLKSTLYKQCLSGDLLLTNGNQIDSNLLLQPSTSTPSSSSSSKLKKSLSNAEDRRRKSLLPWHRKNRSKSKDRGESEYNQKRNECVAVANCDKINEKKNDIHSSRSSLTSLDLAITASSQDTTSKDELTHRTALCRVILSNGSTTVVQIKELETIQELVKRLLEKRGLNYSAFEVYTDKHNKNLDINESSIKLAGCEVTIEQRVVFKLDLPNKKVISVKSKYTKIIIDVLRPILHKYNYNLDQVRVTAGSDVGEIIDLNLPVTSIDGARLNIQCCNDVDIKTNGNPTIKVNNVKVNKLEEITNQVFEGILQEKADSVSTMLKTKSDRGSVKSEDWGSEHSSGIFGRFLRRDSAIHERKKKTQLSKSKTNSNNSSIEDVVSEQNQQVKRPLIAKWKAGVNKLQVPCSESDELVEGLTRAQRSRLEDQRGTEINFELPEFLKNKENDHSRKPLRNNDDLLTGSRFYLSECDMQSTTSAINFKLDSQSNHNNYENRQIINNLSQTNPNNSNNNNNYYNNSTSNSQFKIKNLKIYSPNKLNTSDDSSSKSNHSTPSKQYSFETTVIENKETLKNSSGEPPPLPPKPKIVPIKPPNWGQNSFYRSKEPINIERNKTLFLEQASSSFV